MTVKTLTYIHQLLQDAVDGIKDSFDGAENELEQYRGFHELRDWHSIKCADQSVREEYERLKAYCDSCRNELKAARSALEEFEEREW